MDFGSNFWYLVFVCCCCAWLIQNFSVIGIYSAAAAALANLKLEMKFLYLLVVGKNMCFLWNSNGCCAFVCYLGLLMSKDLPVVAGTDYGLHYITVWLYHIGSFH